MVVPVKIAHEMLGPDTVTKLEAAWERIRGHGQRIDARTFQKALFGSFVMMVRSRT